MKIRVSSNSLVYCAIAVSISYAFLPLIRVLPESIRTVWRIVPLFFLVIAILLAKELHLVLFFIATVFFGVFSGWVRSMVYANGMGKSIISNCLGSVAYWSQMALGYCALVFLKGGQAKKLIIFARNTCIFSCITTIVVNIIIPGATRVSASFDTVDFPYYKYNAGAYSFIYSIVFFLTIALFLSAAKRGSYVFNDKKRWVITSILIVVTIFFSQYMTAIAIAALSFFIFGKEDNWVKFLKMLFVVIFFVLFSNIITSLFKAFADKASNNGMSLLSERLLGISAFAGSGQSKGDVGSRVYLYWVSLQHFLKNPLFGLIGTLNFHRARYHTASELLNLKVGKIMAVGQHSDIIDLLGGSGLFGIIPFIVILSAYYKTIKSYIIKNSTANLLFVIAVQYLLYGVVDHSFSCFDVALVVFVVPALVIIEENGSVM